MRTLQYDWLGFNINLETVKTWIDANMLSATCVGISANSSLELHFDSDPSESDITDFETYYNALDNASNEAVDYYSSASYIAALQSLRDGLDATKAWDALTVLERKLILGQAITATELGI